MNVDRLELLATMLREVIAGTWQATVMPPMGDNATDYGPEDLPQGPDEVKTIWNLSHFLGTDGPPKQCGYAACALGHACLDWRFVSQGLRFEEVWGAVTVEIPVEGDEPDTLEYFDAAAFFFDIATEDSEWLFTPGDNYQEPADVLQRLELYMRGLAAPEPNDDDSE